MGILKQMIDDKLFLSLEMNQDILYIYIYIYHITYEITGTAFRKTPKWHFFSGWTHDREKIARSSCSNCIATGSVITLLFADRCRLTTIRCCTLSKVVIHTVSVGGFAAGTDMFFIFLLLNDNEIDRYELQMANYD